MFPGSMFRQRILAVELEMSLLEAAERRTLSEGQPRVYSKTQIDHPYEYIPHMFSRESIYILLVLSFVEFKVSIQSPFSIVIFFFI